MTTDYVTIKEQTELILNRYIIHHNPAEAKRVSMDAATLAAILNAPTLAPHIMQLMDDLGNAKEDAYLLAQRALRADESVLMLGAEIERLQKKINDMQAKLESAELVMEAQLRFCNTYAYSSRPPATDPYYSMPKYNATKSYDGTIVGVFRSEETE